MTTRLTEEAYEPIRAALFDGTPGQGAEMAKQRIADGIAADPLPLMLWLTDAGIVDHVQFHTTNRTVTISSKNAAPLCTNLRHEDIDGLWLAQLAETDILIDPEEPYAVRLFGSAEDALAAGAAEWGGTQYVEAIEARRSTP